MRPSFPAMKRFDLQGHRGARGLKPENTLPSFEAALDAGVTSIETDIHLTKDGIPVLFHDAAVNEKLCRLLPKSEAPDPFGRPLVRSLTLATNQGLIYVLSMVVVAGLVGGGALGYLVVAGFAQTSLFGKGLAAGLAIVLLGTILDRTTAAASKRIGRASE